MAKQYGVKTGGTNWGHIKTELAQSGYWSAYLVLGGNIAVQVHGLPDEGSAVAEASSHLSSIQLAVATVAWKISRRAS